MVPIPIRTVGSAWPVVLIPIGTIGSTWPVVLIPIGTIGSAWPVVLIPIRTVGTSVIIPMMIGTRRAMVVIPVVAWRARFWRRGIIARTARRRWRRGIIIVVIIIPRIPAVVPVAVVIVAWAPPEAASTPVPTAPVKNFI